MFIKNEMTMRDIIIVEQTKDQNKAIIIKLLTKLSVSLLKMC